MNEKIKKKKKIKLGKLEIGDDNPVYIQSMPKIKSGYEEFISRIKKMISVGCDILRIAVRKNKDLENLEKIEKEIDIPIIADIHFNYKLAVECIHKGVDGIRLNPANIYQKDHIKKVVRKARDYSIPIRVGVNTGSFENFTEVSKFSWAHKLKEKLKENKEKTFSPVNKLIMLTMDYVRFLESLDFYDIMISIKSEDVKETIQANQRLSELSDYPLHLGVTATGVGNEAVIKSSIGIGALLNEGIGDIIRVSLTSDPFKEIKVAKSILSALDIRKFGPDIISCPTCGRLQMDVENMVKKVKRGLKELDNNIKIAIMGCEVNGPGEASHADVGIAGAGDAVLLFKEGKMVEKIDKSKAVETLLKYIKDEN